MIEASGGAWSPLQVASYKVSVYPPAPRLIPDFETQNTCVCTFSRWRAVNHIEVHAFNIKEISGAGEGTWQLKVLVALAEDVIAYSHL